MYKETFTSGVVFWVLQDTYLIALNLLGYSGRQIKKQGVNLIWSISKDLKSEPSSKMFFSKEKT